MTRLALPRVPIVALAVFVARCPPVLAQPAPVGAAAAARPSPSDAGEALRIMRAAADWQLAHPSRHAPYDWTQAAFYTGVMALARVSGDAKYLDAMRAMGERNGWRPGLRPGHADDHAVLATYAQLYEIDRDQRMLNEGLLDRTRFEPHVHRGWAALAGAVQRDGMLGWVQPIGDAPGATTAATTEVYGVGALLLAGSEVVRLDEGRGR